MPGADIIGIKFQGAFQGPAAVIFLAQGFETAAYTQLEL
jgi:hypothetical protein